MLKRKGILVFFAILALVAVLSCALVACNDDDQKADETKTFTVAFKNGDETVKEVSVKEGEALAAEQIPSLIAPDGYEFKGWYVGDQKVEAGFKPTEDVVALAKLDPVAPPAKNKYTVSFSLGDGVTGDAPAAIEDVEEGSSIQLPACEVVRDGFDFAGWVLEGETYAVGDSYEVNSNVTFVASWDVDSRLVVSFKKDGAVIKSIKVEAGAQLAAADFPTAAELEKLHYTFQKWVVENSDPEVVVEAGYQVDASVALVAVYQEDPKYTISFDMGNCPIPTGKPADKVLYEGETFTFQGFNDSYWPGYEFLGWKAEGDPKTYNVNAEYTVGTADVEFVAQWRKIVSLNDFDGVWINSTSYYWLIINAGSGNNATIAGSLGGSGLQIQNDSQATFNAQTQILSYSPTSEMTYTLEIVDGKLSVSYNNSGNGAMSGKVELDKAAACGFEGNYVSGDQNIKIVEGGLILVRDSNANIKNGNSMSSGKNVHSFYFAMLRQGDSDYEVVYRDSEGFGDKGYKLTKDDKGNFVNAGTIFVKDPSEAKTYVSSNNSPKNHAATLYEYTVSDEKVYVFAEQSFDDAYITLSAEDEGKKIYSFSIQGSAEVYNYVIKIGDSAITFAGEERGIYAHADGSDDKGELFLDGFGDGKLNDEAIQYSYDSQAKKLTIGEDTFILKEGNTYEYKKQLDGMQGRYNKVGKDYYLELDGYGNVTFSTGPYGKQFKGTYTLNDDKSVLTLTITSGFIDSGDYTISDNGFTLTKDEDVYQKSVIDVKAQGLWEFGKDAYVLIDNLSVTITTKTKPAQKVNVTEGDLESGYSFNIDSVAYVLKADGDEIKLNDVTLVKAALFLSEGTYYAYHNIYEITVSSAKKITSIKYNSTSIASSSSIANESYQFVDGNRQYAFEVSGNSYAITEKTDGYYFTASDKEYKLSSVKEQDKSLYAKWVKSDDETISLSFASLSDVTVEGGSHAGKYSYSLSSSSDNTVTIGGESLTFKIYGEALLVSSDTSSSSEYIGVYEFDSEVQIAYFPEDWVGNYVDAADSNFQVEITLYSIRVKKDASSDWVTGVYSSGSGTDFYFNFGDVSRSNIYIRKNDLVITNFGSTRKLIKRIFPEDWSGAYQTADGQYNVIISVSSISVGEAGGVLTAGTNIVTTVANSDYTFEAGSVSYRIYKDSNKLMLSVDSADAQELVARVADKFKDVEFWISGGNPHFILDGYGNVKFSSSFDGSNPDIGTYVYDEGSSKLTFAGFTSSGSNYNGEWTLLVYENVITHGSYTFQRPSIFKIAAGTYIGDGIILEIGIWSVTLQLPNKEAVETFDITVEGDAYKFSANDTQYTLSQVGGVTLNGAALTKATFPLSTGTYYAYHNIYTLSISTSGNTLKYLNGSAVTISETKYSFDENGKVKCKIIVGDASYDLVDNAEEGKSLVVDGKQYELKTSKETDLVQPHGVWKLEEGSGKKITISGSSLAPYSISVEDDPASYSISSWSTSSYNGNVTIADVLYTFTLKGQALVVTSESEDAPLVGVYIIESAVIPELFKETQFGTYMSEDLSIAIKITGAKELYLKGSGVEDFTLAENLYQRSSVAAIEFTVNGQKYKFDMFSGYGDFSVGDSYSTTRLYKAILPEAEFLGNWQTEDGSFFVKVEVNRIVLVISSSSHAIISSISTVEEGKKYEFTVSGVKYTISLSEDNQLMFAKADEAEQKLIARVADQYANSKYVYATDSRRWVELDGVGGMHFHDERGNDSYGFYYVSGNVITIYVDGDSAIDSDPDDPWIISDDAIKARSGSPVYNKQA